MGGYDLDEYEESEDYEDEGGEYEEGVEYEEEEERLPTQQELEYLELRQKLKESIRKKMKKKDSSSSLSNSREKKNKMPYDNFGSFFGPSQPVIAQRVIQESKSLLENPHLAERVMKPKNVPDKGGSSNQTISKPRPNGQHPQKVDNYAKPKAKIQMIKNTRDYSFLLSDDAELPIPPKNPTPKRVVPPPKPEVHLSQRQPNNNGRKIINAREERKPVPTSSQTRPKSAPHSQTQSKSQSQSQRPSTSTKLTSSTSLDSRKQVGRNEGSGPSRPTGHKPMPSKMPAVSRQKAIPPPVSRGSIPTGHKPVPARSAPAVVHKRPVEQKRDDRGSSKGNMVRRPVVTSKPQIKQQTARPPPRSQQKKPLLQKRPSRPFEDDDDDDKAIGMIRSMFRYNPNKYHNDDDDSDMEAGFDDIMAEENRSARIAAQEDEEERIKIEEEERREKERKRRKLSRR